MLSGLTGALVAALLTALQVPPPGPGPRPDASAVVPMPQPRPDTCIVPAGPATTEGVVWRGCAPGVEPDVPDDRAAAPRACIVPALHLGPKATGCPRVEPVPLPRLVPGTTPPAQRPGSSPPPS